MSTSRVRGLTAVAATLTTLGVASLAWWSSPTAALGPRLSLVQPSDPMRPAVPAADADTAGMWSAVAEWPMVPIHAVLDQRGRVITYGARITPDATVAQGGLQYDTWDPRTGTAAAASHRQSAEYTVDSFCSIALPEANGSLFIVGGNTQNLAASFDPSSQTFIRHPDLDQPRWYASMVRLPDDRMVVMGGAMPYVADEPSESVLGLTPEVWTPGSGWSELTGATSSTFFGSAQNRWWYPKAFLAPDGNVFGISHDRLFELDVAGNGGSGAITSLGDIPTLLGQPGYLALGASASAVMFAPGRILLAGGGEIGNHRPAAGQAGAVVVDITGATPTVTATGSMAYGRNWGNLVVMPDGSVVMVGGTQDRNENASAALHAEVWRPSSGTWTTLAAATKPRSYHSSALLLPNGSVMSGGGGAPGYPTSQENAEFFYPPSLFARQGATVVWADRPLITSMSGEIRWGGSLQINVSAGHDIAALTLTATGANTHSLSMGARQVSLPVAQAGSVVSTTLPTDPNELPPGTYLLTAVDANGVPSPSQIVEILSSGQAGAVTVYGVGPVVPPTEGTTPPPSTAAPTTTAPGSTVPTSTATPTTSPVVTVPGRTPVTFTGTTPVRLLDTRPGLPALAHASAELDPDRAVSAGPGSTTLVQVAGAGPVPSTGVGSVALNVTVTNPTAPSYLTVYPTGAQQPTASNLNVVPGQTRPNMVIVPLGANGRVSIFNQAGTVDVVVDVLGWFDSGGGFTGVTPARLADTRDLPTVDGQLRGTGPVGEQAHLRVPVAGRGQVPVGAAAVALNVTGTGSSSGTFLTVWPSGARRPTASNLNLQPGETAPNMVIVPLGADGAIDVFNATGSTDVVVDVLGWFAAGSGFTGLTPARLLDTRADGVTVDGASVAEGAQAGGTSRTLRVADRGGVGSRPAAVALNVTVTEPTADAFVTVYPTGGSLPTASNLNAVSGQTVPNLVLVPVAADGTVSIFVSAGASHLVVDVLGWFPG